MKASRKRRERRLTFFVDRNLGGKKIVHRLKGAGLNVRAHDEFFDQDTDDPTWIKHAAKQGWIILSADRHIRLNRVELEAIATAKASVFMPSLKHDRAVEAIADAVISAMRKIRQVIATHRPPFVATVALGGAVNVLMTSDQIRVSLRGQNA